MNAHARAGQWPADRVARLNDLLTVLRPLSAGHSLAGRPPESWLLTIPWENAGTAYQAVTASGLPVHTHTVLQISVDIPEATLTALTHPPARAIALRIAAAAVALDDALRADARPEQPDAVRLGDRLARGPHGPLRDLLAAAHDTSLTDGPFGQAIADTPPLDTLATLLLGNAHLDPHTVLHGIPHARATNALLDVLADTPELLDVAAALDRRPRTLDRHPASPAPRDAPTPHR